MSTAEDPFRTTDDPLDVQHVLAPQAMARLTASQREERVYALMAYSYRLFEQQIAEIEKTHRVAATALLFSGGNDSTTLAHLFKDRVDFAMHARTSIGIKATTDYVIETCANWGLPLDIQDPPIPYRDLVFNKDEMNGFPGPGMHFKCFHRLKERCFRQSRKRVIGPRGHKERMVFVAGRRREESARRRDIPLSDGDGAIRYISPILTWSKLDLNTYRLMHRNGPDPVPHNEVTDLIHMSGECLCGAYAKPGELDLIGTWFPDMAGEIDEMQDHARRLGLKRSTWGHGGGRKGTKVGIGCEACEVTDGGVIFDGDGQVVGIS